MGFHIQWLEEVLPYTGVELRPQWLSERTGVFSSSLVAFRGPCLVPTEALVDAEDVQQEARIQSKEMLHFLGEFFHEDLRLSVARQRLLVALFCETIRKHAPRDGEFRRFGDDIYYCSQQGRKKLTVSIVTASPVSTLLHFGVNIDPSGAPLPAIGLQEFSIDPKDLALEILEKWKEELCSQEQACCKVYPR